MLDSERHGAKIELSLVIPSIRPMDEVARTLGSLAEHGWGKDPVVEIVLFRNGASAEISCDSLVRDLRVSSSEARLPIDESMCAAILRTDGEWVWAIGDDDEVSVMPEQLLAHLHKCPPSCAFVFLVDQDGEGLSLHTGETLQTLFAHFWKRLPFGRIIYRRSVLNEKAFSIYAGTSHAYSGVIWTTLSEANDLIVATLPMDFLKTRDVPKTYSHSVPEVLFSEIPMWFSLLPLDLHEISKSTLNSYLRRMVLRHPVLFLRGARRLTVAHQGAQSPLWFRIISHTIHAVTRPLSSRSVPPTEI